MRVRREKLDRLKARGVDPYPVGFPRTTTIAEVREKYPDLEPDTATGETGRHRRPGDALAHRRQAVLRHAAARATAELQVMVSLDKVGEESLADWKARRRPRRPRRRRPAR